MNRICACGRELDSTTYCNFSFRLTNAEGEVLFEICPHNIVIVDKLPHLEKEKDDRDK